MRRPLVVLSSFSVVAGIWLAGMEFALQHSGYMTRALIDCCIALQALAALVYAWNPRALLGYLTLPGAVAILVVSVSAISRTLSASHFEGFVLIIGALLITQSAFNLAAALSHP